MTKYTPSFYLGLLIVIAVSIIFMANTSSLNFLFFDDSFYYLDLVQAGNIFHPTADGINHATGFHPLWYWILEFFSLFIPATSIFLAIFCVSLCLIWGYYIWFEYFRELYLDIGMTTILSCFIVLYPTSLLIYYSGLETALLVANFGFFMWSLHRFMNTYITEPKYKSGMLALSSSLLFLTRTDTVLIMIPIYIYLLYKFFDDNKKCNEIIKIGATIGATIVTYLLYNYLVSGSFFQSSTGVIPGRRWMEVVDLPTYFKKLYESLDFNATLISHWFGYILLFFIPFIVMWRKINPIYKVLVVGLLLNYLVHNAFRFMFAIWYIAPYFCVFAIWTAKWVQEKKRLAVLFIVALTAFNLTFILNGDDHSTNKVFKYWKSHERPLDQIAAYDLLRKMGYEDKVGAYNSGEFRFFRKGVVNLDGLVNNDVIEAYDENKSIEYLRRNKIYYIVDVGHYFPIYTNKIPMDSLYIVGAIKDPKNEENVTTLLLGLKGNPYGIDSTSLREWRESR